MKMGFLRSKYKYLGWLVLVSGSFLGYLAVSFNYKPDILDLPIFAIYSSYLDKTVMDMTRTNLLDEIAFVFILIGFLFIIFSKQKNENDNIMKLRSQAMFTSVVLNTLFLILSSLLIFGFGFITLLVLNTFSFFVFYLIVFNLLLIRENSRYQ